MSKDTSRRPGMIDVARLAGVSYQTVSRVINDPETVRPKTRERVKEAITTLGYQRNMSARALKTSRSGVIGVVTSATPHYGPSAALSAIENEARNRGFGTQVSALSEQNKDTVRATFDHLLEQNVEGIIVVASQTWVSEAARQLNRTLPVVAVEAGGTPTENVHIVSVDQNVGAALVVEHLVGNGFHRVDHIAGPADWFDARVRLTGWAKEMEKRGLPTRLPAEGDWSCQSGYEIAKEIPSSDLPEALFVANDQMALGVLRAFGERGIRVPEDVALVGFDNVEAAEFFTPSLTTVEQPFHELGQLVCNTLLQALEGDAPAVSFVEPRLVVRESSSKR